MMAPRPPGRRGRPPASDAAALELMVALERIAIEHGEPAGARTLARRVSQLLGMEGTSAAAIEDRLRKKFRQRQAQEYRPNLPRARAEKIEESPAHRAGDEPVYLGLLRDEEEDNSVAPDAAASAGERSRFVGERATARIITTAGDPRRLGGVRFHVNVRIANRDESVSLKLKVESARALQRVMNDTMAALDERMAALGVEREALVNAKR